MNANFRKVRNIAGPMSEVTASQADINHLNADSVKSESYLIDKGGFESSVLVCFSPTGFGTCTAGSGYPLVLTGPGRTTGPSGSNLAYLPLDSYIHSVYMCIGQTGVVGPTTLWLFRGASGLALSSITGTTLIEPLVASVNATGGVVRRMDVIATGYGSITGATP